MSLSEKSIEVVKASAVLVSENAEAISVRMFELLFEHHPQMKALFNDATPDHYKKFATAVSTYANNIDNFDAISQTLETIAQRHVKKDVKAMHYPIFAVSFLGAMDEVLGDEGGRELLEAWKDAYLYLAHMLIVREKELYSV